MSLQCKTILMDPAGEPLCVPGSFWRKLFSRNSRIPIYAGRAVDAAEAFLLYRPGRPAVLTGMQCMRIFFGDCGRPAMWHMSLVRIDPPCPLGPDAAPEPCLERHRNDPLFWFPRREQLAAMARALAQNLARDKDTAPVMRLLAAPTTRPLAPPPHLPRESRPQLC